MFVIELTRGANWQEPAETIDRRECDTDSIDFAAAEGLHWFRKMQKNAAVRRPRESHQGQHSTTSLAERDNRPTLSAISRRQAVSVEGRRSAFAAKRREWRGISNPER